MSENLIVARALLQIKAIHFIPKTPITFKSGILSPVYVDNRILPFHPLIWKKVLRGFLAQIRAERIGFDVIAGIETAGIPHSTALGYMLEKPSVFIRKKLKDHGTKSRIEGGSVKGKRVLLIEDHVSTGMSSLAGVEALRGVGAKVTTCLAITSYAFEQADAAFRNAKTRLITLTTFDVILAEAFKQHILTAKDKAIVEQWFIDPHNWGK